MKPILISNILKPELFNRKTAKKPFSSRSPLAFSLPKNKTAGCDSLEKAGFLALKQRHWPSAKSIFSNLLLETPVGVESDKRLLYQMGLSRALFQMGNLDSAKKNYLSVLDQIKEPCRILFIACKALGKIFLLQNNFPMAEEYYNKAGTWNPHCISLIFHRAMLYLKEKNYTEAEKTFQTFAKTCPNFSKVWMGLALSRKALGDKELAMACLKRCLDLDPKNKKALKLLEKWERPEIPLNQNYGAQKKDKRFLPLFLSFSA